MKLFRDTSSSSSISSYAYNDETLELEVKFKSGVSYRYFDVDTETFAELQSAESIGSFIATRIKQFRYEKIDKFSNEWLQPWEFTKKSDLGQNRWPFPTMGAEIAIPDEEVFDDILEWSPEEEEAFLKMVADKEGDL